MLQTKLSIRFFNNRYWIQRTTSRCSPSKLQPFWTEPVVTISMQQNQQLSVDYIKATVNSQVCLTDITTTYSAILAIDGVDIDEIVLYAVASSRNGINECLQRNICADCAVIRSSRIVLNFLDKYDVWSLQRGCNMLRNGGKMCRGRRKILDVVVSQTDRASILSVVGERCGWYVEVRRRHKSRRSQGQDIVEAKPVTSRRFI